MMRRMIAVCLLTLAQPLAAQWNQTDPKGNPVPSGKEHAYSGDFGTLQLSTVDPNRLHADWATPTPGVEIQTQTTAMRNQRIFTFIVFRGCQAGPDGNCNVTARFEIFDPAGKPYGDPNSGPIWKSLPAPPGNLQLGMSATGLMVENGELLGDYTVRISTTDNVAKITLTTEQVLTITEAK